MNEPKLPQGTEKNPNITIVYGDQITNPPPKAPANKDKISRVEVWDALKSWLIEKIKS